MLSPHAQTSLLQNAGLSQASDPPVRSQTPPEHTEKLHTNLLKWIVFIAWCKLAFYWKPSRK